MRRRTTGTDSLWRSAWLRLFAAVVALSLAGWVGGAAGERAERERQDALERQAEFRTGLPRRIATLQERKRVRDVRRQEAVGEFQRRLRNSSEHSSPEIPVELRNAIDHAWARHGLGGTDFER